MLPGTDVNPAAIIAWDLSSGWAACSVVYAQPCSAAQAGLYMFQPCCYTHIAAIDDHFNSVLNAEVLTARLPTACAGPDLLQAEGTTSSQLAALFWEQLQPDECEDPLLGQAVKCLVFLAHELHTAAAAARGQSLDAAAVTVGPTAAQWEHGDGPEEGALGSSRGLSLAGLVRRVGKLGDDRSGCRQ